MAKKRQSFSKDFKAKVVLEALREESTIQEIAVKYGVQPPVNDVIVTGVHNFTDVQKERVPQVLNKEYIDDVVTIVPDSAFEAARLLARTDGILVGISSGAALSVATDLAKSDENEGKNIVVILPDTGLRYLSTNLFA